MSATNQAGVPVVTCSRCGRTCKCFRTSDGTVYRPFAWRFADDKRPTVGLCGDCKSRLVFFHAATSRWVEDSPDGLSLLGTHVDFDAPRDGQVHEVAR